MEDKSLNCLYRYIYQGIILSEIFHDQYLFSYNWFFIYDRVHVNGSACGHLKPKLITHSFMVRNAWALKNVFQCFSARYLSKNSHFWQKKRGPPRKGICKKWCHTFNNHNFDFPLDMHILYGYMVWCYEIMIYKKNVS